MLDPQQGLPCHRVDGGLRHGAFSVPNTVRGMHLMRITAVRAHPLSVPYAAAALDRARTDGTRPARADGGPHRPGTGRLRRNRRRTAKADLRPGPHIRRRGHRHGPARPHRDLAEAVFADLAASWRYRRVGRHAGAAAAHPSAADHGGDRRHRHRAVGPQGQGGGPAGVPAARRHPHRGVHLRDRRVLPRGRDARRVAPTNSPASSPTAIVR